MQSGLFQETGWNLSQLDHAFLYKVYQKMSVNFIQETEAHHIKFYNVDSSVFSPLYSQ